jgi:diguanylate cyclase (GGDEF)-like protein
MHRSGKFRSALFAGWTCLSLILFAGVANAAAPAIPASDDPALLLKQADRVKSENRDEFINLIEQLDAKATRLTPQQHLYLRYLKAWQTAYFGDLATAIAELNAVIDDSSDATLRFRAGATVVNALAVASRYEEAYARLGHLLDQLPQITDPDARRQGLTVAAILYNLAGQYDLGLEYANKLLVESVDSRAVCAGRQLKFEALYESGKLRSVDEEFQQGVDACVSANEPVYTGLIRIDAAKFEIAQGKYNDAIKLLKDNEAEAQNTHYPRLISAFDSALAQAYWLIGDSQQAQQYAQHAVDGAIKNEYTEPLVNAYEVLYQVAQKEDDYQSALAYHEKFAIAGKGHLNDTSARTLAYQMVKQQVLAKKLQIDALNKRNQVLQLRQEVSKKDVEAGKLYILLLLTVVGSIALWAWRTKRAQLKFMRLAQLDGLTTIFNRQHFIEESEQTLKYAAKSLREVCVIVIDLDHFKEINDKHGHAAGDLVLKRTVAACQTHLRSIDVFGRLGGEEFGILMPDCVPERAADQAEQMRLAIAMLAGSDGGIDFPVFASFGISASRWSGYNLRQLLAHADSALYKAKREGRNRVEVCSTVVVGELLPTGILDRRRG